MLWGSVSHPQPLSTVTAELVLSYPAPTHDSSPPMPQMPVGSSPVPTDRVGWRECVFPPEMSW